MNLKGSHILTFLAIFLLPLLGQSQNAVSNGGFEYYFGLPQNLGDWTNCEGWTNAGSDLSSPDYFHEGGGLAADLPETPVAFVEPHSGKGIMGFTAAKYSEADFREYLTNEFVEPLQQGETYKMSFYITNGSITAASNCGAGVSHLGVAFTSASPNQAWNDVLSTPCQFELDTMLYSKEWVQIEFTFTAPVDAQFATIGVFKTDAEIDMVREENNSANVAYYFIDDVKVELFNPLTDFSDIVDTDRSDPKGEDDTEVPNDFVYVDDSRFYIPNAFTPDGDGVNEVFQPFSPELDNFEFEVFDRWGSPVFSDGSSEVGWDGRDQKGNFAECGIYIWKLYYQGEAEDGKQVLRTLSGTINLLR